MKNQFLTTKEAITEWLDKYSINNYTLISDEKYGFKVNVDEDINLTYANLDFIPVKFNQVGGNFYCSHNELTSLEFCPTTVGGAFHCRNNKIINLEYCPSTIGSNFNCDNNQLTSLEFCPTTVGGYFSCNDNNLSSLEYCPQYVRHDFYCSKNPNLKEIQDITNFKEIYKLHKKHLATLELHTKLESKLTPGLSPATKIKI